MDKEVAGIDYWKKPLIATGILVAICFCIASYRADNEVTQYKGKSYFYGTLKPLKGRTKSYAIIETSGNLDREKITMSIPDYKKIKSTYQCVELLAYINTKRNDSSYKLISYKFSSFLDADKPTCNKMREDNESQPY